MENELPVTGNGDVLIVLSPTRKLKLHSDVLRSASSWFRQSLTDANSAVFSASFLKENRYHTRFHFELVDVPQHGEHGHGRLIMMNLDHMGRVTGSAPRARPENMNGKLPNPVYGYWENVLKAIYSQPLNIAKENLADVLQEVIRMLELAECLGAVDAISKVVDSALTGKGQVLFQSIATNPTAWANLGARIESEMIFTEAMVHLLGKWNGLPQAEKQSLRPEIRYLANKRLASINACKKQIELRIARYYPSSLRRSANSGSRGFSRASYANDIMVWMALALFRHFWNAAITEGRGRFGPDGGYQLYMMVARGGHHYLDREMLNGFYQLFPMGLKAKAVLEEHLCRIKYQITRFVRPLEQNAANLDVRTYKVKHLTHATISTRDLPWVDEYVKGLRGLDEALLDIVLNSGDEAAAQQIMIQHFPNVGGSTTVTAGPSDEASEEGSVGEHDAGDILE